MNAQSILDLARGAIKERTEVELQKIIENITDPNTDAKKNIKEYFSFELGELIDAGKVILTI